MFYQPLLHMCINYIFIRNSLFGVNKNPCIHLEKSNEMEIFSEWFCNMCYFLGPFVFSPKIQCMTHCRRQIKSVAQKKKLLDHGHNKTFLLQTWFQPHNQYDLLILFFQIPNNTSICPLFPNWVWLWMKLLFSTLIMIYRTNKTTIAQNNLSGLLHGNIICFYSVCVCIVTKLCFS